jgi:maltose O-acetyltransferase
MLINFLRQLKYIFRDFRFYLFNYLITFVPCYVLRKAYLKYLMGIRVGKRSFIHMGCLFYPNVSIGDNSVIGRQCHLLGDITIKDNVSITAQTYIFTASHRTNSPTFELFIRPVVIEDYAWIGARAMILPGTTIGKGAVVGAATTVTKDVDPYSIVVGAPARQVGSRSTELEYKLDYFPYFQ